MLVIIKTLLPFLILILANNAALCDGPEGLRNKFFYATFIDSIPYLILNNVQTLYSIQSALLNKGPHYYKLKLMLESSEIYRASVPCLYQGFKAFEITGNSDSYDNLIRLRCGNIMVIEKAAEKGYGPRSGVVIDKVMFISNGWTSSIIIKCRKIKEGKCELLIPEKWTDHLIAYYNDGHGVKKNEQRIMEDLEIPTEVQNKINKLAKGYLPSGNPDEYPYPHVTTTPIRWGIKTIFYATVLSYGEKGVKGKLLLLDKNGNIIQETGEKRYNRIIGLISPSIRKSQSLVVFYGGGYGGGVELLSFDQSKPQLVSRFRVNTIID